MLNKRDNLKKFLQHNNIFICPICKNTLITKEKFLQCCNGHTFDYSKKGSVNLIKTNYYKYSEIYTKDLFFARREFIKNNFYNDVYINIVNILLKYRTTKSDIKILDVGCGEATHSMLILNKIDFDYIYYGFDYSIDAINMASDYISDNKIFIKASVDNIPLKNNSIDFILDFLSPYNEKEFHRVLKNDGIIVKVSPGKEYLKELRHEMNLKEYQKENEVFHTIDNRFDIIDIIRIKKNVLLDNLQMCQLIKMTPISKMETNVNISNITIDLNIYVMRVK